MISSRYIPRNLPCFTPKNIFIVWKIWKSSLLWSVEIQRMSHPRLKAACGFRSVGYLEVLAVRKREDRVAVTFGLSMWNPSSSTEAWHVLFGHVVRASTVCMDTSSLSLPLFSLFLCVCMCVCHYLVEDVGPLYKHGGVEHVVVQFWLDCCAVVPCSSNLLAFAGKSRGRTGLLCVSWWRGTCSSRR